MGNSKLLRSNPIQTYKKREQTEQNNFPTVHQKDVSTKQSKSVLLENKLKTSKS